MNRTDRMNELPQGPSVRVKKGSSNLSGPTNNERPFFVGKATISMGVRCPVCLGLKSLVFAWAA
jgi:hypothetical protein